MRLPLFLAVALAGCLPGLEDDCQSQADCPTGACVGGVCLEADLGAGDSGGGGSGGSGGTTPGDATPEDGAQPPDSDGVDARVVRDGSVDLDASVDGAIPDAATPDAAAPDGPLPDAGADALPPADADPGVDAGCVPVAEICNGLDDDCDGETDEGSDGPLMQRCFEGDPAAQRTGVCQPGFAACNDGLIGACMDQVLPSEEICDGLDNDCDGEVDEGVTQACYGGLPEELEAGGRCRSGEQACEAGDWGACVGEVRPGNDICDGLDNDCDGQVDGDGVCGACEPGAVRPCYSGADDTEGVGRCHEGEQRCREDGQGFGACEGEQTPLAEVCNGEDDDCDGDVDDVPGVGAACREGRGLCARDGVRVCGERDEGGQGIVCDVVLGEPADEVCDGLDNDCDGVTDEDLGLDERCAVGVGACLREGVVVCAEDGSTTCDAAPGAPGEEVCNGADDDCDGEVDNPAAGACECEPGASIVCYDGAPGTAGVGLCVRGTRTCGEDFRYGPCLGAVYPRPETCDGRDEDCDGAIDDGVPGVGAACTVGVGACQRSGTQGCDSAEGELFCDAQPGAPAFERCDGRDNDCDGTVDEEIFGVGDACVVGVGVCAAEGRRECDSDAGALFCDAEAGEPADEVCDNLDNDCDGETDEGDVCRQCIPMEEICNDVDDDCDGEIDEDACNCVAQEEVCNGVEDDCDGAIDEGLGGVRCRTNLPGRCEEGLTVCDGVAVDCVPVNEPLAEICNGMDDDCDGFTDEAPEDGGALCPVAHGSRQCANGECVGELVCEPRWFDADANIANGCERGCGPVAAPRTAYEPAVSFAVDSSGQTSAVAWSSGDALLFSAGGAAQQVAVGKYESVALVSTARGHYTIAALVEVSKDEQLTTQVALFHLRGGAVVAQSVSVREAGPPRLVTGGLDRESVTVAFVAGPDPLQGGSSAYYTKIDLTGVLVPFAHPGVLVSNDLDWVPGMAPGLVNGAAGVGFVGSFSGFVGPGLRYVGIDAQHEDEHVFVNRIDLQGGITAAASGGNVFWASGGAAGVLFWGRIAVGRAASFQQVYNRGGGYLVPTITASQLGLLVYASARDANNLSNASAVLLRDDGTYVGGPLPLDLRNSVEATGAGAFAAWRLGNDAAAADTGCN